jgi:hypothetical protein
MRFYRFRRDASGFEGRRSGATEGEAGAVVGMRSITHYCRALTNTYLVPVG